MNMKAKMKKRIVFPIMILFVFLCVFPFSASADFPELVPGSDKVVFIADGAEGDGSSALSPLKPDSAPEGYDPAAQYPKNHLTSSFYQAIKLLSNAGGGTLVVCGPVRLGFGQSWGNGSAQKDVMTVFFGNKTVRITSVYDGIDYRETNGAKLIIESPAMLNIKGQTVWDNIDIVTASADRAISFNGYTTVIGNGVNCYPEDDGFKGVAQQYVSLTAGGRYEKLSDTSTDLYVFSGTYNCVAGGSWGVIASSPFSNVATNLTLDGDVLILGKLVGACGGAENSPFGGNVNITINGGTYECDIYAGSKNAFTNSDARVNIKVNGGNFKNVWSLCKMAFGYNGNLPGTSVADFRDFPKDDARSLKSLLNATEGFDASELLLPDWYDPNEDYSDDPALPDPDVTAAYGDADGDGKVTANDLARLKRYFAEYDPSANVSSVTLGPHADANGDGKITALDVIRLKRYFAAADPSTGRSDVPLGKVPELIRADYSKYVSYKEFAVPTDLRQAAIDYMLEEANVVWYPGEDFSTSEYFEDQGWGINLNYKKGVEYHGLPYANTYSTIADFERYLDPGRVFTTSPDRWLGVSWRSVPGLECASSVITALAHFSDISGYSSSFCPGDKNFNAVPVGDYTYTEGTVSTKEITSSNKTEKMFECYALLQKGDVIMRRTESGSAHVRMIHGNRVYRRDDGTILAKSFVTTLEQTNQFDKTRTDGVNTTWYIDHTYTYDTLFLSFYVPTTVKEYTEGVKTPFYIGLTKEIRPEDLASGKLIGSVETNSYLRNAVYELYRLDGSLAARFVKHNTLDYETKQFGTWKKQFNNADYAARLFDGLESGKYTFVLTAGIPAGEAELARVEFTYAK